MGADQDRLVDVLLREELGGETPPDLADEILARAFPRRERVPRFVLATAAAIAAMLILLVVGWMMLGSRSPAPEVLEGPAVAEKSVREALETPEVKVDKPVPKVARAPEVKVDKPVPKVAKAPEVKVDKPVPKMARAPEVKVDKPVPKMAKAPEVKVDKPVPKVAKAPEVKVDKPVPEVAKAPEVKVDKPVPEAAKAPTVADGGKVVRPCDCRSRGGIMIAAGESMPEEEGRTSTTGKDSGKSRGSTTGKYSGKSRGSTAGTTGKDSGKSRGSTAGTTGKYPGKSRKSTARLSLSKSKSAFSGRVHGVVVKDGKKNSFLFKVVRVLRVHENNEAEIPKALEGRSVRVGPGWVRGEGGTWHYADLHRFFINNLRKGQAFALDVWSCERGVFAIRELSREQRKWAEQKRKKQDRRIKSR